MVTFGAIEGATDYILGGPLDLVTTHNWDCNPTHNWGNPYKHI